MASYNLLNKQHRFIFCIDPKCGCTTIKDWFIRILDKPESEKPIRIDPFMVPANTVHSFDDYLRIWFVRDPFRRLVSFYYQFVVFRPQNWCFADHEKMQTLEGRTFQELIHILGELHDCGRRLQHHLQPQTRSLIDVPFDAIVKIEELEERKQELMSMVKTKIEPAHLNQQKSSEIDMQNAFLLSPDELKNSPVFSYSSFWNNELLEIAERVYSNDCELYNSL